MAIKVKSYTRRVNGKLIQIGGYNREGTAAKQQTLADRMKQKPGAGEGYLARKKLAEQAAATAPKTEEVIRELTGQKPVGEAQQSTQEKPHNVAPAETIQKAMANPNAKVRTPDGKVMPSSQYKKEINKIQQKERAFGASKERNEGVSKAGARKQEKEAKKKREEGKSERGEITKGAVEKRATKSEKKPENKKAVDKKDERIKTPYTTKEGKTAYYYPTKEDLELERRMDKEEKAKEVEKSSKAEVAEMERKGAIWNRERPLKKKIKEAEAHAESKRKEVEASEPKPKKEKSFLRKVAEAPFQHIADTFMESYDTKRAEIHRRKLASSPAYRRQYRRKVEAAKAEEAEERAGKAALKREAKAAERGVEKATKALEREREKIKREQERERQKEETMRRKQKYGG